jgi:uncharacterized protein (DUF1810 family)
LARFVGAQDGVFAQALGEVRAGRKRTHWMWFIFPQLAGLGHSEMARHYGLASLDEAAAYLAHPVLGSRLEQITTAMLAIDPPDPHRVFGYPDELKLRSSLTLFALVPGADPVFRRALDRVFHGERDEITLRLLGQSPTATGRDGSADQPDQLGG